MTSCSNSVSDRLQWAARFIMRGQSQLNIMPDGSRTGATAQPPPPHYVPRTPGVAKMTIAEADLIGANGIDPRCR